jgi:hypothetical protein
MIGLLNSRGEAVLKRGTPLLSNLSVFLFFITSMASGVVSAQVTTEWATRYNGPINGYDSPSGMAVDDVGNVYVTGSIPGAGGASDYATVKYDPDGNELWAVMYNGPGDFNDYALAIAVDKAGNTYVTGESTGSDGFYDFATIKYDTDGNALWVARYNGPANGWDHAVAITVDPSGNVYVAGYRTGVDGTSDSDWVTVKYDKDGSQLWVTTYDGPAGGSDGAVAIALDAAGFVYVTGTITGSDGTSDYATIKYDTDGNELWVATYGFSNWQEFSAALAVDTLSNVYVTGNSQTPFNPQDPNSTNSDYATVKYDANGNLLWVARYNGPGSSFQSSIDAAVDIAVDAAGHVYVTGRSERAGPTMDYTTIKYDVSGSELWVARYSGVGSNGLNVPVKIALDSAGNIYVAGYSSGSGVTLDYATVEYDSNGNELWVARYNGPSNESDSPVALAVDASQNVYVTGLSVGSGTSADYATVKLKVDTGGGSGGGSGSQGGSDACFIETTSGSYLPPHPWILVLAALICIAGLTQMARR